MNEDMEAKIFLIVWVLSFAATVITVEMLNVVFWISFAVFAGCSIYLSKHGERMKREL